VSFAQLTELSDNALTPRNTSIVEVVLRGRRDLLERHHLLRELAYLRFQLRSDVVRSDSTSRLPTVRVSLHDWSHPSADVLAFDRLFASMQREREFGVVLWCTDWLVGSQSAVELLNRYQRLLPLPQGTVVPREVETALAAYHQLFPFHDRAARARHEAGLDTWRWLLRLTPSAGLELQLAALFHDLALGKLEEALQFLALDRRVLLRTVELALFYDEPGRDLELAKLRTARSLSFLSLESWQFLRRHGPRATRTKAEQLLLAMDSAALCVAATTRQPPVVSDVLNAVLMATERADGESVSSGVRLRL
jgi:hypothetical protein